jgi:hypothetical protein
VQSSQGIRPPRQTREWRLDAEARITSLDALDDRRGGGCETAAVVGKIEPLSEHRMNAQRRVVGEHRRVIAAFAGNQQTLPRLASVGEHEDQPSRQIAGNATEHRPREKRAVAGQRLDKRREAVTG